MKRLLVIILTALAVVLGATVAAAAPPPLPIASLDEVSLTAVVGPSPNVCGLGTTGARALFTVRGHEYGLLLLQTDALPMRFIVMDMAEGDETPVWVGYLRGGTLVVTRVVTYQELIAAPVCAWLTERGT